MSVSKEDFEEGLKGLGFVSVILIVVAIFMFGVATAKTVFDTGWNVDKTYEKIEEIQRAQKEQKRDLESILKKLEK